MSWHAAMYKNCEEITKGLTAAVAAVIDSPKPDYARAGVVIGVACVAMLGGIASALAACADEIARS